MKGIIAVLCFSLLGLSNAWGENEKTSDTTTENETPKIDLDVLTGVPPTRSFYAGEPEATLNGSCIQVSFAEAVPYASIYVVNASTGEVVYAMEYACQSMMDIDLSGCQAGEYILRIETEDAVYEGSFSL